MSNSGRRNPDNQRDRIQEALRGKLLPSSTTKIHSLKEKRKSIISENVRPNKSVRAVTAINTLRPQQNLTTINCEIIKLNLSEKGCFNASILPINDKILCVYRNNEYEFSSCLLDKNYNVINRTIKTFYRFQIKNIADPRLILTADNKVLMSYSTHTNIHDEHIVASIIMNLNRNEEIDVESTMRVSPKSLNSRQKNWMPFIHDGRIYFIASVCPHEIYEFEMTGEAVMKYRTPWDNKWFNHQCLRGNTNACRLPDGNFLGTFHTASNQGGALFYDNGCYVFSGKPPFEPIMCGRRTYLPAEAAVEPHYRKNKNIICTFPCGMIIDENKISISYGDNDSCVKILHTNIADLMSTMIEIK